MAGIYVNDEGTWKLPKSVWINQLGTWRVCKNVYVNSGGAWKELIKTVDITSSQATFNLYEYLGSPAQAISVVVNIASFVEIFSEGPSLPQWCPYNCSTLRTNLPARPTAFTVGNFPSGSTVIINNNGYISGGGGFGGAGANSFAKGPNYSNQRSGSTGGTGGAGILKGSSNNYDCTIVNTGTIAGGGGGGGGAGSYYVYPQVQYQQGGWSQGGNGGDGAGITGYSRTQGGTSASNTDKNVTATDGGQGGALGERGTRSENSGVNAGDGGSAGVAIGGGIEIAVSGTIIGVTG